MKNVGPIDVVVRLVLAAAFLSLFVLLPGNLRWIGLIGFVPLLTAIFRFCPLYSLLGLQTRGAGFR
ncbi:Protein of unknown function (DUF2892) [Terriglobus roseus DSM 18391]|uniref:Inner membrane protein YgaP-like transmembrane domain-containing protein n=1 Tax=Terriglobus roseus (strain DSM 18391 / NRRL B-41598 / KBS 63) TaxID=926566 RepID=I3ZLV0_TERRK|nr:DUF2892 domain-containing protein [Terriglobus roseus]AFL90218.1 Protein of unknown function (DUF2892) [Terriglobus roseus DSM 18391]